MSNRKSRLALVPPPEQGGFAASDDTMRAFALQYYEWQRVTNYSPVTIDTRRKCLDKFFIWCSERNVERISEVTPGILERYQKHVFYYRNPKTGRARSTATQLQLVQYVCLFFKWLVKKRFLALDPTGTLDLPRRPFRLPKDILTVKEVEQVMAMIDIATPKGLRDRTFLELLYSSGIRRKEIAALKTRDVDLDRGLLIVRQGKGQKDRVIPIGERAAHWIRRYLEESRPVLAAAKADPEQLFLSVTGKPLALGSLTELARTLLKSSKVDKGGACHVFRHTFATHLLDNEADIRHIQAMLGHKHLESTKLYTHVSIKKLKEVHTAKHPTALLSPKSPKKSPAK